MDHDGDLAGLYAEDICGLGVVDFVDDLNFDEMISGSEGSALAFAAFVGPWAEGVGVGVGDASVVFGVLKVSGHAEASSDDVGGPFGEYAALLGEVELDFSGSADSAGDVGEEGLGEFGDAVFDILGEQVGVE